MEGSDREDAEVGVCCSSSSAETAWTELKRELCGLQRPSVQVKLVPQEEGKKQDL